MRFTSCLRLQLSIRSSRFVETYNLIRLHRDTNIIFKCFHLCYKCFAYASFFFVISAFFSRSSFNVILFWFSDFTHGATTRKQAKIYCGEKLREKSSRKAISPYPNILCFPTSTIAREMLIQFSWFKYNLQFKHWFFMDWKAEKKDAHADVWCETKERAKENDEEGIQ